MTYDNIEERVLVLIWGHAPEELDFMLKFMEDVYELSKVRFHDTQTKIFENLIAKYNENSSQNGDKIRDLIVSDFEQNEGSSLTFNSKFLYAMYQLVYEYAVLEPEYIGKQSDIIENFTCAYEGLSINPKALSEALEKFEAKLSA